MSERANREKFSPLNPKKFRVIGVKRHSFLVRPDFIINSTHIVNGKRVGIIILPQIKMPAKAPVLQISGFNIIRTANEIMLTKKTIVLSLFIKNIFRQ